MADSNSGGRVVMGTENGYLLAYDVRLGEGGRGKVEFVGKNKCHNYITSIAADGGVIVTGGKDGKVGVHFEGGVKVYKEVTIPPPEPLKRQNDRQRELDKQVIVR